MSRAALNSTTALPSGLIDTSGASIPSTRKPVAVNIAMLPLIAPEALPPLPAGMEARLLVGRPEDGHKPAIVIWHPVHEVSIEVPLDEMDRVTEAAAMLSASLGHALRVDH